MPTDYAHPLERFYHWESSTPDRVYLRQAKEGKWEDYTWAQLGKHARQLANYLKQKEYPEGSRIAIYSQNSPDWFVADFAIMMSGHVSVPLYPGQSSASLRYVLEHSESRLILLGAADKPGNIERSLNGLNLDRIGLQGCGNECDITLDGISQSYSPLLENPVPDEDRIYTLMYTSGTTGHPKGVIHHFENAALCATVMQKDFRLDENSRFFSYLPLSHTAERILVLLNSLYAGAVVHFPESMATFNADLQRASPTFFFSVPRLWKKFKEGVESQLSPGVIDSMLADPEKAEGFRHQVQKQLGLHDADIIITGSAPTPIDVLLWFQKLGMILRNGYGMTENCIHGCIDLDEHPTMGTVGRPLTGCEVTIGEGDEILFRSPALMKGYYREPEKTAEVLRDGYYYTGDTGRIDDEGRLTVTGRLGEAFKTTKGKFVKPTHIENVMADIPCLGQMCAIGHGMEAPVLLAGLNELGADWKPEKVESCIIQMLPDLNRRLSHHEQISTVFLVRDEWTIENGLLTPTMKMIRNAIVKRYEAAVNALPGDGAVAWE